MNQVRKREVRNPASERLLRVVLHSESFSHYSDTDLAELSADDLDYFIAELGKGETRIRQLRKRMEALQNGARRACPQCGRLVAGRPDAIYCDSGCRVRAYRARRKAS
jgi:hypothetical protein